MTRPMQESSSKTHETQHAVRQLQRRPAPASAAATYPYIYRRMTTDETVSAGVNQILTWQTTNNTQGTGYFSAPNSDVTNILAQGVYDFLVAVKWDPEFNAGTFIAVALDSAGWYPSSYWKEPYNGGTAIRQDSVHTFAFSARMPSGTTSFDVQVCHESGSSQTVVDAMLRVAYRVAWAGTAEADLAFL